MKKAVGLFFCLAVIAYFLSTQFVFMGSCSGDCYVWFEGNSFDWAYVCLSLKRDQWAHEMLFDRLIASGNESEPSYNERLVRDPLAMVKLTLHYDCRSTIWGTVRTYECDQCMILVKKADKYQIYRIPIKTSDPMPIELVCRVE